MSDEDLIKAQIEPMENLLAQSKKHLEEVIDFIQQVVLIGDSTGFMRKKLCEDAKRFLDLVLLLQEYLKEQEYNARSGSRLGIGAILVKEQLIPQLKGDFDNLKKLWEEAKAQPTNSKFVEMYWLSLASFYEILRHIFDDEYVLLKELRSTLGKIKEEKDQAIGEMTKMKREMEHLVALKTQVDDLQEKAKKATEEIFGVLGAKQSIAKSSALADKFKERSESFRKIMVLWTVGLFAILVASVYFSFWRLTSVGLSSGYAINELSFSVISVGAFVWFAWLSTKRIGHYFRLAEDYAYKATIAEVYEGFRIEAENSDEGMKEKLLTSVFNRFDESPIRLIEKDSHGSPWHELATDVAKELLRKAIKEK
jgi:hypothetical protein